MCLKKKTDFVPYEDVKGLAEDYARTAAEKVGGNQAIDEPCLAKAKKAVIGEARAILKQSVKNVKEGIPDDDSRAQIQPAIDKAIKRAGTVYKGCTR